MEYPSPELVAEAFIRLVQPEHGVTTKLPALTVADSKGVPKNNWADKKIWITPRSYGAGRVPNVPVRKPIVRVDIWGLPVDKPRHWGRAINLAQELISYGTDWYTNIQLPMPYPGYYAVEISSLSMFESRRLEGDPQNLARVQFDMEMAYKFLGAASTPVISPTPDPGSGSGTGEGDEHSTFSRPLPSTVWSITHNLGWYPVVQIFDANWNELEAGITHLNTNTFIVQFNQPTAGYAVIS